MIMLKDDAYNNNPIHQLAGYMFFLYISYRSRLSTMISINITSQLNISLHVLCMISLLFDIIDNCVFLFKYRIAQNSGGVKLWRISNGRYPQLRILTSRNNMASIVWGLCTENVW